MTFVGIYLYLCLLLVLPLELILIIQIDGGKLTSSDINKLSIHALRHLEIMNVVNFE